MKAEEAKKIAKGFRSDESVLVRLNHEIEVSASVGKYYVNIPERISDSVRKSLEANGFQVGETSLCTANNAEYTKISWE